MSESISRREFEEYTAHVGTRNADMVERLADVNDSLSIVNANITGLRAQVEGVEARLDAIEARSSSVERRMAALETRMSSLESVIAVFTAKAERRELSVLAMFQELVRLVGGLSDLDDPGDPPEASP